MRKQPEAVLQNRYMMHHDRAKIHRSRSTMPNFVGLNERLSQFGLYRLYTKLTNHAASTARSINSKETWKKNKIVVVALEHHFYEHDGRIYSNLAFFYSYWERYLTAFDEVRVFARVQPVKEKGEKFQLAEGPGVRFISVRDYHGFRGFIRALLPNLRTAFRVARTHDAFVLRSGNVSNIIWLAVLASRKPYLREFPGNILLGTIGVKGKSWPIVTASHVLHRLAKLQARFAKANGFVSHDCREIYSNARVPSYVFTSFSTDEIHIQRWFNPTSAPKLVSVVVLSRLEAEKNIEFLLRVMGRLPTDTVSLSVIGAGSQRQRLEEIAQAEGVNAIFHGLVTDRKRLFEMLIENDLYVLPSTTEGTPRSLLEAMAVGVPAIGSRVGGIPEILPDEYMFSPHDPDELFDRLNQFIAAPMSSRIARSKQMQEIIRAKFLKAAQEEIMHDYWRNLDDI